MIIHSTQPVQRHRVHERFRVLQGRRAKAVTVKKTQQLTKKKREYRRKPGAKSRRELEAKGISPPAGPYDLKQLLKMDAALVRDIAEREGVQPSGKLEMRSGKRDLALEIIGKQNRVPVADMESARAKMGKTMGMRIKKLLRMGRLDEFSELLVGGQAETGAQGSSEGIVAHGGGDITPETVAG